MAGTKSFKKFKISHARCGFSLNIATANNQVTEYKRRLKRFSINTTSQLNITMDPEGLIFF